MICPKCNVELADGLTECPGCGVVFAKMRPRISKAGASSAAADDSGQGASSTLKALLLPEPVGPSALVIAGRGLLLVLLTAWSFKFIGASIESNMVGGSFMHLVNLPFHEAGHIIFSPFGRFMHVLGGTLGQLLMPAICLAALLVHTRDPFGAAAALWWLAESFMDIAPYINDARALKLILLGGVTGRDVANYHDWEYLLRTLGLLKMDHALARLAQGIGIVLMVGALLWAAAVLWMQFRALQKTSLKTA